METSSILIWGVVGLSILYLILKKLRGLTTSVPKKKVVCLGDSNTWYPDETITPTAKQWVTLLSKRQELTVINKGAPGKTTAMMLANFQTDVLDQKPDVLIIEEGANDALNGVTGDITMSNIDQMVRNAKANNISVMIMNCNPQQFSAEYVDARPSLAGKNRNWEDPNYLPLTRSLEAAYCLANNIPLINIYDELLNPDGTQNTSLNAPDKVHMNADGHQIVLGKIEKLFGLGFVSSDDPFDVTTWNPSDNVGFTLSNGNKTARNPTGSESSYIRANGQARNSGKYYFEMTTTVNENTCMGVAIPVSAITWNTYANMVILGTTSGRCYGYNGTGQLANWGTAGGAGTYGFAVDLDAKTIKVRQGTGVWSAALSISHLPSVLPAVAYAPSADTITINCGDLDFIGVIPNGYNSWDGIKVGPVIAGDTLVNGRGSTISSDGLTASILGVDGYARSTSAKTSGKFYFEALPNSSTGQELIGILDSATTPPTDGAFSAAKSLSLSTFDGKVYTGGGTATWGSAARGVKIGFAVDIDNKTIKYTTDGSTWSITKSWSGWSASGIAVFLTTGTSATYSTKVNFGASAFAYAIPEGYSAWDVLDIPQTTFSDVVGPGTSLSTDKLTVTCDGNYGGYAKSSNAKTSGKYCFEFTVTSAGSTPPGDLVGVVDANTPINSSNSYYTQNSRTVWQYNGKVYMGETPWYSAIGTGLALMIAIDVDNRTIKVKKQGADWSTVQSWPSGWSASGVCAFVSCGYMAFTGTINFGATPFVNTMPDGYSAWDSIAITDDQSVI